MVEALRQWQTALDLAGVRDARALNALTDDERTEWLLFWRDVESAVLTANESSASSDLSTSPAQ